LFCCPRWLLPSHSLFHCSLHSFPWRELPLRTFRVRVICTRPGRAWTHRLPTLPPAKERRYRLGPESARRSGRPLRDLSAEFFSSLVTASCSCLCACFLLHRPWGRVYRAPPSSVRADRILREGAQQPRVLNSSAAGPDHRVPAAGGILTASGDLAGVRDRFGFRLTAGERREFGDIAIVDDGCVAVFGGRRDNTRLVDVIGFV